MNRNRIALLLFCIAVFIVCFALIDDMAYASQRARSIRRRTKSPTRKTVSPVRPRTPTRRRVPVRRPVRARVIRKPSKTTLKPKKIVKRPVRRVSVRKRKTTTTRIPKRVAKKPKRIARKKKTTIRKTGTPRKPKKPTKASPIQTTASKTPVIMMHGVTGSEHDFDGTIRFMRASAKHRNRPIHAQTMYSGASSLFNDVHKQMVAFYNEVKSLERKHRYTKYHLLCFSQGALICRTALQNFSDFKAVNVILVSGPQMGQFGLPEFLKRHLPAGLATRAAHLLFYTKASQASLSIANYWRDPYEMDRYRKHCNFLPIMNGEVRDNNTAQRKRNLINNIRGKLVLIGGPSDDVITPPTSSLFEWWPAKQNSGSTIPMEKQPIYTQDLIGLKTLAQQNRLVKRKYYGVKHDQWLNNKTVFGSAIDPYLSD